MQVALNAIKAVGVILPKEVLAGLALGREFMRECRDTFAAWPRQFSAQR